MFFIKYLLGIAITGLLYTGLYSTDGFYNYRYDIIDKSIKDDKINNVSVESVIRTDIALASILSYIGIVVIIINYCSYIYEKQN